MDKIEALLELVRVLDYHPTPKVSEKLTLYNPDSVKAFSKAGLVLPGELMPRELTPRKDFMFTVKGDISFSVGDMNGTQDDQIFLIDTDWQGNELPRSRSSHGYLGRGTIEGSVTVEFGDLYEGDMALPRAILKTPVTTGFVEVYDLTGDNQFYKSNIVAPWVTKPTFALRTPAPSLEHLSSV